jgi:hypothetical protein
MIPSPTIAKFYNIFWANHHCQEIFLLHKEQLFQKEEIEFGESKKHFYQQRFVFSNSDKKHLPFERVDQRIQDSNIELNHGLIAKSAKNINQEKIKEYLSDRFGKAFAQLSPKMNGKGITKIRFFSELATAFLSEKNLIRFLQKYSLISGKISSFEELKQSIEDFVKNEALSWLNAENLPDVLSVLDSFSGFYNNHNFNDLIEASKFYVDILYDSRDVRERLHLFDSLYEAGILIGGAYKTHYECTHCPPNTFSGNVVLNVSPSKLKLKCPNCGKEAFYLAPYKIDGDIFGHIQSKDGLLFHAVQNLLTTHKVIFQSNVPYGKDIEIDIQILGNGGHAITDIIEIKMFKTDRPDDTILNNLRTGLRKLLTSRQKLLKLNEKFKNVRYHFITNIDDEKLCDALKENFRSEIKDYQIFIHCPKAFGMFISSGYS